MDVLQELGNVTVVADSLLHLLRNGVEHGLESVEERVRLGKRKSGRLTLLALQQGEEIWVSVEDDGQGLDLEILAESGIERHGTPAKNVVPLTGSDPVPATGRAHAGAAADGQSGCDRRTGLSSVNKYLRELRGKIAVSSRPGKGTRVTLRVPRPLPTP
jgi:two-component system chemotaxis sensor kinase CheA